MDNSQYVLYLAVFIVIATVILSLPDFERREAEPEDPGFDCRFDSFYRGAPLLKIVAPTLRLIPKDKDGLAYLIWSDNPNTKVHMIPETRAGLLILSAPQPEAGLFSLTLSESGALTYDERTATEAEPTATGSGTCVKTQTASGDQS